MNKFVIGAGRACMSRRRPDNYLIGSEGQETLFHLDTSAARASMPAAETASSRSMTRAMNTNERGAAETGREGEGESDESESNDHGKHSAIKMNEPENSHWRASFGKISLFSV